jgi:hypothetical protein
LRIVFLHSHFLRSFDYLRAHVSHSVDFLHSYLFLSLTIIPHFFNVLPWYFVSRFEHVFVAFIVSLLVFHDRCSFRLAINLVLVIGNRHLLLRFHHFGRLNADRRRL